MAKVIATMWHQSVSASGAHPTPVRLREAVVVRDGELTEIADALRAGRSLLLVGAMGSGKTHLVDSFTASDAFYVTASERSRTHRAAALAPGTPVWVSVGASGDRSGEPLGALLDVLPDVEIDVTASIGSVRRGVVEALRAMSAGRPLIVRVEDAHLLDGLSARVLAGLARQDDLQIVATMREHGAGTSPWLQLWKDGVAQRLDVGPLSHEQVDSWLAQTLGSTVAAETRHQVWQVCAGNPLRLVEATGAAVRSGVLRLATDVWVWSGQAPLSPRIIDVVRHEIATVGPQGRRALDLVAVARGLDRDVLERIVPAPVIDELLEQGFLSVRYRDDARAWRAQNAAASAHSARLPHLTCGVMVSDVLIEVSSAGQRREMLSTLRTVQGDLESQSGLELVTAVAAALECGLPETPERIVSALHSSLMAGDCETVRRLATIALTVLPAQTPERLDVLGARATAWRFLDQPARAMRDVAQLREEMARTELDPARYVHHVVAAAEVVVAVEQYHHDDHESALRALTLARHQVESRLESQVPVEAALRLDVARLVVMACAGRISEVRDQAMALVTGPDAMSPHVLQLIPALVVDLNQTGRLLEAQALVQRHLGVAIAHADTRPWSVAEILSAGFLALIGLGEVEAAEGVVGMLSAEGGPFNIERTTGHLIRGGLATLRGRWSDARAELHSANVQFEVADVIGLSAMTLVSEALMAIASGDAAAGRDLLERARVAPSRLYSAYMQGEIRLLRVDASAWLHASDSLDEALALADWSSERGLHRVELDAVHRAVFALHTDGRIAAGADLLERAHTAAAVVDGRRAQALLAHVVAMFSGDHDLIMVATRELGACGVWLPLSLPPVALTRREQEIAGLAAGGLSSKEIAERLVLSVRTVDSHLSRIFTKSGVRSRRELAAVLRTHGSAAPARQG